MAKFAGAQNAMKAAGFNIDSAFDKDFTKYRVTEIEVKNETLTSVKAGQCAMSVSVEACWDTIKQQAAAAGAPRYFVVNAEKHLCLVIYIPEGTKMKEKFTYSFSIWVFHK